MTTDDIIKELKANNPEKAKELVGVLAEAIMADARREAAMSRLQEASTLKELERQSKTISSVKSVEEKTQAVIVQPKVEATPVSEPEKAPSVNKPVTERREFKPRTQADIEAQEKFKKHREKVEFMRKNNLTKGQHKKPVVQRQDDGSFLTVNAPELRTGIKGLETVLPKPEAEAPQAQA